MKKFGFGRNKKNQSPGWWLNLVIRRLTSLVQSALVGLKIFLLLNVTALEAAGL